MRKPWSIICFADDKEQKLLQSSSYLGEKGPFNKVFELPKEFYRSNCGDFLLMPTPQNAVEFLAFYTVFLYRTLVRKPPSPTICFLVPPKKLYPEDFDYKKILQEACWAIRVLFKSRINSHGFKFDGANPDTTIAELIEKHGFQVYFLLPSGMFVAQDL